MPAPIAVRVSPSTASTCLKTPADVLVLHSYTGTVNSLRELPHVECEPFPSLSPSFAPRSLPMRAFFADPSATASFAVQSRTASRTSTNLEAIPRREHTSAMSYERRYKPVRAMPAPSECLEHPNTVPSSSRAAARAGSSLCCGQISSCSRLNLACNTFSNQTRGLLCALVSDAAESSPSCVLLSRFSMSSSAHGAGCRRSTANAPTITPSAFYPTRVVAAGPELQIAAKSECGLWSMSRHLTGQWFSNGGIVV